MKKFKYTLQHLRPTPKLRPRVLVPYLPPNVLQITTESGLESGFE